MTVYDLFFTQNAYTHAYIHVQFSTNTLSVKTSTKMSAQKIWTKFIYKA